MSYDQPALPTIWKASPCSLSYVDKAIPFDHSRRFQFQSIYYKDDPNKPKLKQDPLSKPQMILHQFRKKIKEATKSKNHTYHVNHKKGSKKRSIQDILNQKKQIHMNSKAEKVSQRLYSSNAPNKILCMNFDSNGNRSSFFEDNDETKQNSSQIKSRSRSPKQLKMQNLQKKSSDNIYITSTPRTDLSKPINFNPGPGSYHYSIDMINKMKNNKSSIHQRRKEGTASVLSNNSSSKKFQSNSRLLQQSSELKTQVKSKLLRTKLNNSLKGK